MEGKQTGGQQGFLKGAAILLGALALVKVAGALFKIPLNGIIGDVGMGISAQRIRFIIRFFV